MWDLETLKKINDEECRRRERLKLSKESARKWRADIKRGMIAQSYGKKKHGSH